MQKDQKDRIIKRLFAEKCMTQSFVLIDEKIKSSLLYSDLGLCLDALERYDDALLDFAQVENDPSKWKVLTDVLDAGLAWKRGDPPEIIYLDLNCMHDKANRLYLNTLPQPDYYNRVVQPDKNKDSSTNFAEALIFSTSETLFDLLKKTIPNHSECSAETVNMAITQLHADIKQAEAVNNIFVQGQLKKQLTVAEDLLKIIELKALDIPYEKKPDDKKKSYYVLAEAAQGVTEKVSLISRDKVIEQLGNLQKAKFNDIDGYLEGRDKYKLRIDGMLKLPKHGKNEEVLKEFVALNISRIVSLDTTSCSMVTYGGKPALFIPFEDIKLLSEFAKGKTFGAFNSSKVYEHYSTINPVGSGLQGDLFTDDFGSALGLLYVCGDPDSIGGYNQNKALRDGHSLFIFDQVVMASESFRLDSRISLVPDRFIMQHTRHGQGRNRTIIEDSSLVAKFNSVMCLIEQEQKISENLRRIVNAYQEEIKKIDVELDRKPQSEIAARLKEQKAQLTKLSKEASTLHGVVQKRIDRIFENLPNEGNGLDTKDMCQALILGKLLHNPVLFTDMGRPYKNPWTRRQDNQVKKIEILPNDKLLITFASGVSPEMVAFLKRAGDLKSLQHKSLNQLVMSKDDFARLNEKMLHPEAITEINHQKDYLNENDLLQISKAYGKGHRTKILDLVQRYQIGMKTWALDQKLDLMTNAQIYLKGYVETAKDKGFAQHVLKKMQFDVQKHLQVMMGELKPDNIDQAFAAALKFDRVEMFNQVVSSAIRSKSLKSDEFLGFLNHCIKLGASQINYPQAIKESQVLNEMGKQFLAQLKQPLKKISEDELNEDMLNNLDCVGLRQEELSSQYVQFEENELSLKQDVHQSQPVKDDVAPHLMIKNP